MSVSIVSTVAMMSMSTVSTVAMMSMSTVSTVARMKVVLMMLTLVGLAASQRRPPFNLNFFGRPSFPTRGGPRPAPVRSGDQVDDTRDRSQYYFSWRHDNGRKYRGEEAHGLCTSLGGGWQPVGISSPGELSYISGIVGSNRLEYIWTGGVISSGGFRWLNGEPFNVNDWSHTGGFGRPQPDNREGNESCLAILNNVYGDGVKWHDVACRHPKPVICERQI
ncbi:uncharacterized protein [Procambarus clarkii]|uniref:uncharacterized protein n=1 Tax=Procambarus clarkii TaxID=6728 RepID=UPI0037442E18